jgi:hypothetical protein
MHTGSYVNGKWYHPSSNQISRNINPADTADVIAEFPLAGASDVRLAVDAATAAAKSWRKTPGPERGRVLWRAADIARRRVDEIAQTLTREEGKILKEAKGEVLKGIAVLEYNAGAGFRMHGHTLPSESRDTFTYTLRQPLGAVEFSVGDSSLEERAGDRVRQHRRVQAIGADAGDFGPARGNLRGGRPAARRFQHGRRQRLGGR